MSRSNKYIESSTSGVQTARTVQDNTESEYTKACQDPFDSQDPYDGAIKLLATVCDGELEHDSMGGGPKEDTNIISVPPPATVDMVSQESVAAIDSQSATPTATALMKSALDCW